MDQLRWIQYHGIPLLAVFDHLPQPSEGVRVDEVQACLVVVGVLLGLSDGFFIEINSCDVITAGLEFGGQGEAAGVAAEVQHPTLRPLAKALAVVALITEESGFVARGKVRAIADAVLSETDEGRGWVVHFGHVRDANVFHQTDVGIDMNDMVLGAEFRV